MFRNIRRLTGLIIILVLINNSAFSQTPDTAKAPEKKEEKKPEKKWYETLSIRGYAHIRYNRLSTNNNLGCEQCDRSWGDPNNRGLFFRRSRIVISGSVHERVNIYIQTDFANTINAQSFQNFLQIRDFYADIFLDKNKEFRLRPGISKVPFGFDNLQSSQNRLPLDRSDAINSAMPNERDLGVFFMFTPKAIRERFKSLQNAQLKGSGDYGVVAVGFYNGQSMNKPDLNDDFHVVARVDYPFLIGSKQILEAGVHAFRGLYRIGFDDWKDRRAGANLILYPQPFGFQAEYNFGTGPQFNPDPKVLKIQQTDLNGGYALINYQLKFGKQFLYPFVRAHYYDGGKKHEADARKYNVKELEIGAEWQPIPAVELTAQYVISDRNYVDKAKPVNHQYANLLRLQLQLNY
jgi:hypothetical protein